MEAALPKSWERLGLVQVTTATLKALAPADSTAVAKAIDEMGVRSARAQGLSKPITTYSVMRTSDNRLYMAVDRGVLRGILRVGKRSLYVRRKPDSEYSQISPLCVLDFYVHESCQRSGVGAQLFRHMLSREEAQPHKLGYDRPSHKLVSFLRRHCGV